MKFSELVRLLERNGFRLVREKGSIRYYGKSGHSNLVRIDYHGVKADRHLPVHPEGGRDQAEVKHAGLALLTGDRSDSRSGLFGFYSEELPGFTGVGHSVEDCLYKAKHGFAEHIQLLREQGLTVPARNPDPTVVIRNEAMRKSA